MSSQGSNNQHDQERQLQELRQILFGQNNQHLTDALRHNAREIVSDVFSEALKDRQDKDGSVKKVMAPLVDKSVEYSVTNRKEQFVGYLYPIVGSVVRKSVTAFLSEFIERTNQLLENSLTIKGLTWRIKARQAGIPYANYVASQTFNYRVEQVFLIHRETGLLLRNVSYNQQQSEDADLISSMLTAINDFVSDSFKPNIEGREQTLNIVKTDDFTLVLKAGPSAVLVAAVTGNMPQKIADLLQLTIEELHSLYEKQLHEFKGDAAPFADCDQQLMDCLVSELKETAKQKKSKPWMAWSILLIAVIGMSYYIYKLWIVQDYVERIQAINEQPGIMLVQLESKGIKQIKVDVMRDPNAKPIIKWLREQNIPKKMISLTEKSYLSLEPQIVQERVNVVAAQFAGITVIGQGESTRLIGKLNQPKFSELNLALSKLPGLTDAQIMLQDVEVTSPERVNIDDNAHFNALIKLKIGQINSTSIEFAIDSTELSPQAREKLAAITAQAKSLLMLARKVQLDVNFLLIGASDTNGSQSYNEMLSVKRAQTVKNAIQDGGIPADKLNAIGIGVIDLPAAGNDTRKVLFNVITTQAAQQ
ncbi:OmpA family protein [uncultured Paraglaciecola sp.]|uniref:OmpA family protein n=1 Tax=uncultured Paraglaciecola sp. TaxID=1765024 RepID=UPI0030DD8BE1|tara:strand:+ start:4180 stop:5949 length:1770 start_codon:yes stop_codon:yes gene_type:complete